MKSKTVVFSIMSLIAACILFACNSTDKKESQTEKQLDSLTLPMAVDTSNSIKKEWEAFKTDANDRIKQNDDSLQVFKKRIEAEDAKIKVKYDSEIARLQRRNNDMKTILSGYKNEGKDNFEKFRLDFDNRMDTIRANITDVFKRRKS